MSEAKNGDRVKVHYTGKLDTGEVFDTSVDQEPLEFTIGDGRLLPDFENAVLGMNPGETKSFEIEAENGYGEYRKNLVINVNSSDFPDDFEPVVGQRLELKPEEGESTIVTVTEVTEETVTLDANHPLAGQRLNFEITLEEIL